MNLRRFIAFLLFPLLAIAAYGASTPVNNGIMQGTLTFSQTSTVGFIPWANIGLTNGALPGISSITPTTGTLTLNGPLVFPYNAQAGLVAIDGSGNITPFANGVNGTVLTMSSGTPTWAFNATGNVSNSGTPSAGQLGQWVDATHIAGVTAINPASIGATTPGTGAFTTLAASSTVSGTGFSTYLASPPAIGGTAPSTGKFTTMNVTTTSTFTGVMTVSSAVLWGSGVRQTFAPNGTTPGFNPGSNAGDPSSPSNGDMWYDSTNNLLRVRINGSSVSLGSSGVSSITGTAGQVLANGTSGSGQINGVTLTLPAALTGLTSITASASNSFTITAGSGGNFNIVLAPTGSGNVQDSSTTASTSTITGALVDSGGLGVAGAIWAGSIQGTPIGTTTTAAGNFTSVGATTAGTGAFTTLSASSTVSGAGFSAYLASPPAIGSTSASTGAFTTLSASSTVSGAGFTSLFASPPAIGTTSAAAGNFTSIGATTAGTGAFTTITASTSIQLPMPGHLYLGAIGAGSSDLYNGGSGNTSFSGGAYYNGSSWVAETTTPTIVQNAAGTIAFYVDSGKTAGNTYTPTQVATISSTGINGTPIGTSTPSTGSFSTGIFSGLITATGGVTSSSQPVTAIQFAVGSSTGSLTNGTISFNTTYGMILVAANNASSSYDITLTNYLGSATFQEIHGSNLWLISALSNSSTQSLSALAIDWSTDNSFSKTLAANSTFTFSNQHDGETITVALTNTASNYTVTWPTVKWPGGSAPVQTIGAHTDVYTFWDVAGTIYGSAVQNF